MTNEQVFNFFKGKRDVECKVTDALINSGFYQKEGGYRVVADVCDISKPSQWWHLMSYCLTKYEFHKEKDQYPFTPCGELLFWMAEVSNAVPKDKLIELQTEIANNPDDRRGNNNKIKDLCWSKIVETVEQNTKKE